MNRTPRFAGLWPRFLALLVDLLEGLAGAMLGKRVVGLRVVRAR